MREVNRENLILDITVSWYIVNFANQLVATKKNTLTDKLITKLENYY